MPNKTLSLEWLSFAEKNLETAKLLYKHNHYTDVIAIDIQQSIEKSFKAVFAYYGEKIPRTHSLEILYNYVSSKNVIKDIDKKKLILISDYYVSERYPGPKYFMPDRDEINDSIVFAEIIVNQINDYINNNP
jgi:HEPN domain-containing protein